MTLASWLSVWCGLTALGWLGGWRKAKKASKSSPYRLRPTPHAPGLDSRLAVVVPARDEAAGIVRCVEAVLQDPDPNLSLTVLDDGSTDDTAVLLARLADRHPRLRVVSGGNQPLPEGWLGKPWACQRAAEAALVDDPEHLLFLDADVALQPGAIRSAVAYARAQNLDLLSVMGTLELGSFWERAIQPAVVGLILAGNDLSRINDPSRRPARPLANGQFLLFRTSAWQHIGGHHAVKGAIIDDVGLSTATVQAGGSYHLVFGPKLFQCRMYTGFSEIWSGWTKNLFEGMAASWTLVVGLVGFVALSVVLPWVLVPVALLTVDPILGTTAGLAVLGQVLTRVHLDRRFGQDSRYALTIPLGWSVLAAIAVASGLRYHRGGGTWKGRSLPAGG